MLNELEKQLGFAVDKSIINDLPYNYIKCENIFEEKIYNNLLVNFPSIDKFGPSVKRNNFAITLNKNDLLHIDADFTEYISLIDYLCSKEFFLKVVKKLNMENWIDQNLCTDLQSLNVNSSLVNNKSDTDIFLDCRVGINTPNNKLSTVRDAHIDATNVLYTGMLYLRDEYDDSNGANFIVYKPIKENIKVGIGRTLDKSKLMIVDEIKYQGNNMIIFQNGKNSIHGVSPRGVTPYARKFIAFNATYKDPLFNLEAKKSNIVFHYFKKIRSLFSIT